MKNHIFLPLAVIFCVITFLTGCSWQRVPVSPQFSPSKTIPLKIGVTLGDTQPSTHYGSGIVDYWKQTKLFDSIIFPYREGDSVDGVLRMTITGGWKGKGAAAGFVVGLTLGLASPGVGPSITGKHDITAILFKESQEEWRYSSHVESSVSFGLGADVEEVSRKADALQTRKLAVAIARKVDENRSVIIDSFTK